SGLVGYNGIHGFRESLEDENVDFDPALACKKFPSISFGCFPTVELYDGPSTNKETMDLHDCATSRMDPNWLDPESIYLDLQSLYGGNISSGNSSSIVETKSESPEVNIESSSQKVEDNKPSRTAEMADDRASRSTVEILDKGIDCINGLTKRRRNLLESCGFHTLRKLLHHFPRTYADVHNANVKIDDGQYLIFVGKVVSSRGIRASSTFSFLEVQVACEVADGDPETDSRKRTICLHLKKFFRGIRFTYPAFLNSIQGKYREGDAVCVSGKVRAMRNKDHFEMREFNVDVMKEDDDPCSTSAEGRPYPIYPSKKGLKPDFLRDAITR
ncbi:hypothetical protein M569_04478, partial [Genlisea aurea]